MSSRFEGARAQIQKAWPSLAGAGAGALRVMLLFGSAAIAFALILAPLMERKTQSALFSPSVDKVTTSSIGDKGGLYTVRLKSSPDDACIIRPDGSRHGIC